jgi:hypothetical protein
MEDKKAKLASLCENFNVDILYAFGSRAKEVFTWLQNDEAHLAEDESDVDIGAKPALGVEYDVKQKVRLAIALEDLFGAQCVDLAILPEVDPFVAVNIIRSERLYAADDYRADEYDLYILRRSGDLAFMERQRQRLILGEEP